MDLEVEDTPFLPPGSVTPGPSLVQVYSHHSQQLLPYFSAHTQAHHSVSGKAVVHRYVNIFLLRKGQTTHLHRIKDF